MEDDMGFGDLRVAEARAYEEAHQRIVDACKEAFAVPENQANCSGLVKYVGEKLGIKIGQTGNGQANDIFDEIQKGSPWLYLGKGNAGAVKGAYYATQGFFVVAAWKSSSGSGHVAVVTDLQDLKGVKEVTDRNVAATWGVLDHAELAKFKEGIRSSFGADKRDAVIYAAQFPTKFS
jgi:hypothetical protein